MLKEDRYTAPHYAFYVREMKIKAYAQVVLSISLSVKTSEPIGPLIVVTTEMTLGKVNGLSNLKNYLENYLPFLRNFPMLIKNPLYFEFYDLFTDNGG